MMARQELLLHPGTHKTGTTAIQKSLDKNRSWLAARGVAYPLLRTGRRRGGAAHHALAKAVADDNRKRLQDYSRQVERAADGARLTVLSSEAIYRLRLRNVSGDAEDFFASHKAYLERLRELFRDFDISVLIYFRRPDRFAVSHFKTVIANGRAVGPFGYYVEKSPWLYAYSRHIALLQDVFGQVETRCYEAEVRNGFVGGFYSALGLDEPPTDGPGAMRVSHSNRATLWLLRSRSEDDDKQRHQHRALFASEHARSPLFEEAEPSTLWPSDVAFTEFVERHRLEYEIGPFDIPEGIGCPTTVWTDDMHDAAEASFARWRRDNAERLSRRAAARRDYWWQADPPATRSPLSWIARGLRWRKARP